MRIGTERAALAAILAVALVLRAAALTDPLWADEALSVLISRQPALDLILRPLDPTSPLFYLLQKLFVPGAESPVLTRLPALAYAVLAILLFHAIGRLMGGPRCGLMAAGLAALSPILIDYGHEARAYSLLVLLAALATWAALRAASPGEGRAPTWIAAAASVAAVYTHPTAALLSGPLMALLGWRWLRTRGAAASGWPVAAGIALLALVPEAIRLVRFRRRSNDFDWLAQPDSAEAARIVAEVWTGVGGLLGLAILAVLVLLSWHYRTALRATLGARPGAAPVLGVVLAQPLLLLAAGWVGQPMLLERSMMPSLVAALPAAAFILTVPGALAAARAMVGAVGAALVLASQGLARPNEDWRGGARVIAGTEPTVVVACPRWQAPALLAALGAIGWRGDLVVPTSRGMVLVPRGGRWSERQFDYEYHDEFAHRRKVEIYPARLVRLDSSAFLVAWGMCSDEHRALIERWAGGATIERLWVGRGLDDDHPNRVERWRVAPRPRAALLAIPGPERPRASRSAPR